MQSRAPAAASPRAARRDTRDGGCVLSMKVSGLGELKSWVLQFGAEAEVLAPKALREAVAKELRALQRLYRS